MTPRRRGGTRNGSITGRLETFSLASEDEQRAWKANWDPIWLLQLHNTVKISAYGTTITLGKVTGGGTCGNCDIVDIHALDAAA